MASFHFDKGHHKLVDGEAAGNLMLGRYQLADLDDSAVAPFNDWNLYQDLKRQSGCIKVELSRVHMDHSAWFLTGIQAVYRSTFADGREEESEAPTHPFQRFRYRQYGESKRSTLELKEDEFITNIFIRRVDKISDRIELQTNQRNVAFGSPAFSNFRKSWLLPFSEDEQERNLHKVVAFAGITSEMSEDMGCFSESQNWGRIKEFVLLRDLVSQDRATPTEGRQANILQTLATDTNQDIFRNVLSYLIPENK